MGSRPTQRVDLVVLGSGGAGLTTALAAAASGMTVTVVEKSRFLGGTTAVSGGSLWIPQNRYQQAAGVTDSRDLAQQYLHAIAGPSADLGLLDVFVDRVHDMHDFLVDQTGLEFTINLHHPDYRQDLAGSLAGGRTVQCGLFDTKRLPNDVAASLRPPHSTVPVTKLEMDEWGMDTIDQWDWALIAKRTSEGLVGMGTALVGELVAACLSHGVEFHTMTAGEKLTTGSDGKIDGVWVTNDAWGRLRLETAVGVVLATGGYEWNPSFTQQFLGVPELKPASPPSNVGDGLRIAMDVHASLVNMDEAWWGAVLWAEGDTYDGAPLYRPTSGLRALPGSIMVDRRGRRFINEAMNYHDLGRGIRGSDQAGPEPARQPSWLVFDQQFRTSYSVGTVGPSAPTPGWMRTAATVEELASEIGVDVTGLVEQIREFNVGAEAGQDPVFHRGESAYDRYYGDKDPTLPAPNLRPLGPGPFYAVAIHLGCLGTNGGPRIDEWGRVLDDNDEAIPGLFAAGNAAASPFRIGYPGAGATLSGGMTFAYVAGQAMGA